MAPERVVGMGVATLLVTIMASTCAPLQAESPPDELSGLAWLAGCWSSHEQGASVEECWLAPAGGLMVGVHRDVSEGGRTAFEFLRIEHTADGVVYLASPGGREPTPFRMVSLEEHRVVFANPEHDFPQRIIYRLDAGDTLTARVEAEIDGTLRKLQWTWTRSSWQQQPEGGR